MTEQRVPSHLTKPGSTMSPDLVAKQAGKALGSTRRESRLSPRLRLARTAGSRAPGKSYDAS
jgi:hypothetical protein